jgi:predicted amidohydrolase YtcJ
MRRMPPGTANPLAQRRKRRTWPLIIVLAAAILLPAGCGRHETPPPADLILRNAAVYTMNPARPWAEAVAVRGDMIVFTGADRDVPLYRGRETKTVDLGGRMVLPGFQDSHIHLVSGGIELGHCLLSGLPDKASVFAAIRDYAARNPRSPWIVGGGWELPVFPNANPTKEELDKLVPDRPAYLDAADGHSAWVNTRALKIAGVTKDTPDPAGGRIERDPRTGEPTGTLRESAAGLVERHVPETPPEEYIKGLRAGLEMTARLGITSIIEASAREKILDAYAALDRSGEMHLRVLASLYVDTSQGTGEVARLIKLRDAYRTPHLKATTAKIFVDGVMESHTAALLEPYLDRPGDRGTPLLEPEAFDRLATALDAADFQIHVHAIGDRAIRMTLDALEAARRANGPKDLRHHICHLELVDPADIPRFKTLGVVANFQALWAYADPYITDLTIPILGPERSRWLYPIGSVARTGAVIAGGSDWSVSSANPLEAIQVALTRRGPEAPAGPAWIPEEVVDLPTMLAAYTTHGAYLSHEEDLRGSIVPGKIADLIVLDKNLFKIARVEIHTARVLLTVFEGKVIYRDPAF